MTQKYVHALHGCAPTPLAHYLKALGVLRLVSEQADPEVRGAWVDDGFRLVTKLTREELITFFAEKYEPTPLLSPWNGGSGFYFQEGKTADVDPNTGKRIKTGDRDQPTAATEALAAIEGSTSPRLVKWRQALAYCRSGNTSRTSAPNKEEKGLMVAALRNGAPEDLLLWITTATSTVSVDEQKSPASIALAFPPLLGSGGNEGNFDYTSNQAQALVAVIERGETSSEDVEAVLFGAPFPGQKGTSPGQFAPGLLGGANSGPGMVGESCFALWDYILMLEGSLCLQASSVRLLGSTSKLTAAMPFTVISSTAGYGSATAESETATTDQLMPLWRGAATMPEIRALFREGRLLRGRRESSSAVDASIAIANLGAARGIDSFVRYGYLDRNGKSAFATPLCRIQSKFSPNIALLNELDRFTASLARASREKDASRALERMSRRLDGGLMRVAVGGQPDDWEALVGVLGEVEDLYLAAPRSSASSNVEPIPVLSPSWLERLPDDTEVRLAIAIASQTSEKLGPIRTNVVAFEGERYPKFRKSADALVSDPQVVWSGGDLISNLIAIANRRAIDGTRERSLGFPLEGRRFATLADIADFLRGATDDARIARLLRGLLSIRWAEAKPTEWTNVGEPSALHALVRLAFLPGKLEPSKVALRREDRNLPPLRPVLDGTILRLLEAGRVNDAVERILTRLVASGARPTLRTVAASPTLARRLAAAVAIPVAPADQVLLLRAVCKPFSDSKKDEAQS